MSTRGEPIIHLGDHRQIACDMVSTGQALCKAGTTTRTEDEQLIIGRIEHVTCKNCRRIARFPERLAYVASYQLPTMPTPAFYYFRTKTVARRSIAGIAGATVRSVALTRVQYEKYITRGELA